MNTYDYQRIWGTKRKKNAKYQHLSDFSTTGISNSNFEEKSWWNKNNNFTTNFIMNKAQV